MRDGTRELRRIYAITTELEVAVDAIGVVAADERLSASAKRHAISAILAHHLGGTFDAGAAELANYATALAAREKELERVKASRATLQTQLSAALKRLREEG